VFEYEDAAKRQARTLGLTHADIDAVLDYLCSVASLHEIFYLWRPFLADPRDDFLLELAVSARCDTIVTFNARHFAGVSQFGVGAIGPRTFLQQIGEL
jgi:hypothetical protein